MSKRKYWGFTHLGSKNKLCDFLCINMLLNELDKEYMIDLFSGGLSVASMASNSPLCCVFANDLNKYTIAFEKMLLTQKKLPSSFYNFVTKDTFEYVRDNPDNFLEEYVGFVLLVYSFGCDQRTYLYAKEIESGIEAIHDCLVFGNYEKANRIEQLKGFARYVDSEIDFMDYESQTEAKTKLFSDCLKKYIHDHPENKEYLERIDVMKHLNIVRSMFKMLSNIKTEKIKLSSMDYLKFYEQLPLEIKQKAFFYLDPPYEQTKKYPFMVDNYDKMWDFFRNCPYPVYISSYNAPDDIKPFATIETIQNLDNGRANINLFRSKEKSVAIENLYYNGK